MPDAAIWHSGCFPAGRSGFEACGYVTKQAGYRFSFLANQRIGEGS